MITVNTLPDLDNVRIFLIKREFVDAFDLRLAVAMAFPRYSIHVLDQTEAGLRTTCAIVRSAEMIPSLVLLEQTYREAEGVRMIGRLRELPELRQFPVVLLGDGDDPFSEIIALQDGADAFVPLADRASELPRVGRDLARFWWDRRLSKSA